MIYSYVLRYEYSNSFSRNIMIYKSAHISEPFANRLRYMQVSARASISPMGRRLPSRRARKNERGKLCRSHALDQEKRRIIRENASKLLFEQRQLRKLKEKKEHETKREQH